MSLQLKISPSSSQGLVARRAITSRYSAILLLVQALYKDKRIEALNMMKAAAGIPVGASASKSVVVTRELTVAHFHEDMPEVYGTPLMIYLMEVAAAAAIEEYLPEGWVSVGVLVDVKHLAATPVGLTVTARAEVVYVDEHTVTFSVEAHDGVEKIGEGRHLRAPVNLKRFVKRIGLKASGIDKTLP